MPNPIALSSSCRWIVVVALSPLLAGFTASDRPEGSSGDVGCSSDTSSSSSSASTSSGASGCDSGSGTTSAWGGGGGWGPTTERVCADGAVAVYVDGVFQHRSGCAHGCNAGASRCNECEVADLAPRCFEDDLRRCGSDGRWERVEACSGPCRDGRCLPCHPDRVVCEGETKQVCDASGEGFVAAAAEVCRFGCVEGAGCAPCSPMCEGHQVERCDADGAELPPVPCAWGCREAEEGATCLASNPHCADGVLTFPDREGELGTCFGCGPCGVSAVELLWSTGCLAAEECAGSLQRLADGALGDALSCSTCDCPPFAAPLPLELGRGMRFEAVDGFGCPGRVATYELVIAEPLEASFYIYNFYAESEAALYQRVHTPGPPGADPPATFTGAPLSLLHDGETGEILTHAQAFEPGTWFLTVSGEFLLWIRTE